MVKFDPCHSKHKTCGLMYRGGGVLKDGSATMAEINLWTDHSRVSERGIVTFLPRLVPGGDLENVMPVVSSTVSWTAQGSWRTTTHKTFLRFLVAQCVWWRHWLWSLVSHRGTFVCRRKKSKLGNDGRCLHSFFEHSDVTEMDSEALHGICCRNWDIEYPTHGTARSRSSSLR